MRKTLLFLAASWLTALGGYAQTATDDHFTISEVTLQPGGAEVAATFGVEGSRIYTAYNGDFTLPTGVEVAFRNGSERVSMIKNGGIYPATVEYDEDEDVETTTYTHLFGCKFGYIEEAKLYNNLRVISYSTKSENFTAMSGKLFRAYLKASPYMRPGEYNIHASGLNLTTNEEVILADGHKGNGKKYVPANTDYPVITVGTTSTVSLKISATNKYSTLVLPFDAAIPDGVKAYSCHESTDDALLLVEATAFEAYKPYILYAESGYEGTLTGEVNAAKYVEVATDGMLSGAILPQEVSSGYVLQNQGSGAKFYHVDHAVFSIPEGRCWINSDAANVRAFEFADVTSIPALEASPAGGRLEGAAYDLAGHRVTTMEVGHIYIIGTQKILKLK